MQVYSSFKIFTVIAGLPAYFIQVIRDFICSCTFNLGNLTDAATLSSLPSACAGFHSSQWFLEQMTLISHVNLSQQTKKSASFFILQNELPSKVRVCSCRTCSPIVSHSSPWSVSQVAPHFASSLLLPLQIDLVGGMNWGLCDLASWIVDQTLYRPDSRNKDCQLH